MAKKKGKRPGSAQQVVGGNFWTFELKQDFHCAVTQLHKRTKNKRPDGDCLSYRHERPHLPATNEYALTPKEELQLADDVAFLFPWEESPGTITAATIEEHDDGKKLIMRLGVNEDPKPRAVGQLKDMMAIVRSYAIKARDRGPMREKLFNTIVDCRKTRILQRLQNHSAGIPRKGGCVPLHGRLREHLRLLERNLPHLSTDQRTEFNNIAQQLKHLFPLYQVLDTCRESDRTNFLKSAVKASHDLCTKNGFHSFEQQLTELGFSPSYSEMKDIHEVDKIARYYGVCSSILRVARRHQTLFGNIDIRVCQAPKRNLSTVPAGATAPCHIHGEVRLVMHYEQCPHHPPPRAIGSSRSMCFLCNMLIQKHGHYWISHSHKRLYNFWTIPDVNWMNAHQVDRFQNIIAQMTIELNRLRERPPPTIAAWVDESRLHLPFSGSPSTASNLSIASTDSDATIRPAPSVRILTPVPETPRFMVEIPFPTQEPPRETVDGLEEDAISEHSRLPLTRSSSSEGSKPLSWPPAQFELEVDVTSKPITPPASPILTFRPPAPRSPFLPKPLSCAPSVPTLLPSSRPLSHVFSVRGPDVEVSICGTLFIFEFVTVATGTLSISWHDVTDSREPFSPDVAAGLHGSLESRPCHTIDLAALEKEAVCIRRDEGRTCDFTVIIDDKTVAKVGIRWDEEN